MLRPRSRRFPRLFQLSLALACLILVPWSIVFATHLRIRLQPSLPEVSAADVKEITRITKAIEDHRSVFGAYPPDFSSGNPVEEIKQHVRRRYPLRDHDADVPSNVDRLGPENALHFWLNLRYEKNTQFPLTGQVHDDAIPMTEVEMDKAIFAADTFRIAKENGVTELWDTKEYRKQEASYRILIDQQYREYYTLKTPTYIVSFEPARLTKQNTYLLRSSAAPLIYFRADNYETASYRGHPSWGVATAYQTVLSDSGERQYVEPSVFQIISAGSDGSYGEGPIRVSDAGLDEGHTDNITSFSTIPLGMRYRQLRRRRAIQQRTVSLFMAITCTAAYPFVAILRRQEDGTLLLARSLQRQWTATESSETWASILQREKRLRRENAIRRFDRTDRSSETRPTSHRHRSSRSLP